MVVDIAASSELVEFKSCDMVFLCVPVFAMRDVLERLIPNLKPDCVITDVGSTAVDVSRIMAKQGSRVNTSEAIPAGSEKSGYSAAKTNLFENAYYDYTDKTHLNTKNNS